MGEIAYSVVYILIVHGGVIMNRVNAKLWAAIRERDLTQADFAKIVGDDPSIVSRVINGLWNLDEMRKVKYSKALKLKPDDLFQD